MGLTIKWDCTYSCNLNCKHCINGDFLGDNKDELNAETFEKIINDISKIYKIDYLHMLGGEPTVKKDFLEICEILEKNKIEFGFNTNSLLFKGELSKNIISKKYLKSIVFSVEGPSQEINDEIRGKKVFNKIINSINEANQNKYLFNSNVSLEINFVISKKNYKYISEMIELCLDKNINRLNILAMIEEGNAKESGYSIDMNEQIYSMIEIAKYLPIIEGKLVIDPKFTRPLARKYMKEVLNLEFPESAHGCGAGLIFGFMDNKGRIFPCDRSKKIDTDLDFDEMSLIKYNFKELWGKEYFSKPFSIMESKIYKNLYPCKYCEYFSKKCFPCPLGIQKNTILNECSFYFNEMYNKNFKTVKPIKEHIRFLHNCDNSITAISTKSFNTIKLNIDSYKILQNIINRNISDFDSVLSYCSRNKVDIQLYFKFLEYLENRGFIEYEE